MNFKTLPLTAPPAPPNEPFVPKPPATSDWKARVRDEAAELEKKHKALTDFIKTDAFNALPKEHRRLLQDQEWLMDQYLAILRVRLTLRD